MGVGLNIVEEISEALKKIENLKAWAEDYKLPYSYANQIKNKKKVKLGHETVLKFCAALGLPMGGESVEPPEPGGLLYLNVLGRVAAGAPTDPGDSVTLENILGQIEITESGWKALFPRVDPRGLVALRVSGDSMSPIHRDGDTIFVRPTSDKDKVRDGQQIVVRLPGEGYTFKVWRKTHVLEALNHAFPPRPMPRGAILWGIYVCGTKTE